MYKILLRQFATTVGTLLSRQVDVSIFHAKLLPSYFYFNDDHFSKIIKTGHQYHWSSMKHITFLCYSQRTKKQLQIELKNSIMWPAFSVRGDIGMVWGKRCS